MDENGVQAEAGHGSASDCGLFTIRARRDSYANPSLKEAATKLVDAALRSALDDFFAEAGHVFDALVRARAVTRLKSIDQLNLKRHPKGTRALRVDGIDAALEIGGAIFEHTRFDHSIRVTAHMIALGLRLGLPHKGIITGAVAGLLHDIGHAPFSHAGDDVCVAHGLAPHETRGQAMVERDPEITGILSRAEIPPGQVIQVMREEGTGGAMLKLMDTCAYVTLDSACAGLPIDEKFGAKVIATVHGVEHETLCVRAVVPIHDVLTHRATLFREVYCSFSNRIIAEALTAVCNWAVRTRIATPHSFADSSDAEMTLLLAAHLNKRTLPGWSYAAWRLAHGAIDTLSEWKIERFRTKEEVAAHCGNLGGTHRDGTIVLQPCEYTSKVVRVKTPDGVLHHLQAPQELCTDEARSFFVLSFKG